MQLRLSSQLTNTLRRNRFLGYVDLRGTTYQSATIATGFGAHLAQPILRKRVEGREDDITEQEAIDIINDCMRVLFYRDARSINKVCLHGLLSMSEMETHIDVYSFKEQKSRKLVSRSANRTVQRLNGHLQRRLEDTVLRSFIFFFLAVILLQWRR